MESITNFLARLSKYDWLNEVIPGVAFAVLCRTLDLPMVHTDNLFETIVKYIIAGTIISRIGAVFIEPTLKGIGLVKFAPYEQYLDYRKANEQDADMLMARLNFNRTMISLWFVTLGLKLFCSLPTCGHVRCLQFSWSDVVLVVLAVLFIVAYVRQVGFVRGRISAYIKSKA